MRKFHSWPKVTLRVALSALGFLSLLTGLSVSAHAQVAVPELDPGSMANALMVLSGGLLVLTGRRKLK
jgi:hypothetical protein